MSDTLTFEQAITKMKEGKICEIAATETKYRILRQQLTWGGSTTSGYILESNSYKSWKTCFDHTSYLISQEWVICEESE